MPECRAKVARVSSAVEARPPFENPARDVGLTHAGRKPGAPFASFFISEVLFAAKRERSSGMRACSRFRGARTTGKTLQPNERHAVRVSRTCAEAPAFRGDVMSDPAASTGAAKTASSIFPRPRILGLIRPLTGLETNASSEAQAPSLDRRYLI